MKKEKIKFYPLNLKNNKLFNLIIKNSFIIAVIILIISLGYIQYSNINLKKIRAVAREKKVIENQKIIEKMNKYSNNLDVNNKAYSTKYELLINKSNPISEDDVKNYEIVSVKDNIFPNIRLEKETYNNYLELKENLLQRGYYISIRSGFRTFEDSQSIYNSYSYSNGKNYADKYVAKPGESEHNTGLAFDFVISKDEKALSTDYDSDEYFYLENIAYLYGFIIRYPKDKETITGYEYEPWHLRYVGKKLAKYLKKNNLTLEEYYEID